MYQPAQTEPNHQDPKSPRSKASGKNLNKSINGVRRHYNKNYDCNMFQVRLRV